MKIMDRSRSILVKKFGGYDSLSVEDYDLEPLGDNIEVEVEYAGLNFADLYTRKGLMNKPLPFVLGMECSGKILRIGSKDETDLKVGQRVICYDHNGGMYRDLVRVPPNRCFPLPEEISCQMGAAMFVNYLTAYASVILIGNLKPKESVLILSCTGGVGLAAVQLAKTIENTRIVGTASQYKEETAKENGVDTFYPNDVIDDRIDIGKFDLILATQSGDVLPYLESLLKPLGRIVLLGVNNIIYDEHKFSMWNLLYLWWNSKNLCLTDLVMHNRVIGGLHLGTLLEADRQKIVDALEEIYKLYRDKKIKITIDSVHPMSKIVEATKVLAERRNIGKVLISMKE